MIDSVGCQWCDTVVVSYTLNMYETINHSQVYLSQKPCTNEFAIMFKNRLPCVDVEIRSVEGKIVFVQSYTDASKIILMAQTWDPGIYIFETYWGNTTLVNNL
ncbi:MAG TPA: hypothetical protein VK177_10420 [Flavobacteriales bacterium]|nr:hypothetical protein [Flavobacteriales bacterium]